MYQPKNVYITEDSNNLEYPNLNIKATLVLKNITEILFRFVDVAVQFKF